MHVIKNNKMFKTIKYNIIKKDIIKFYKNFEKKRKYYLLLGLIKQFNTKQHLQIFAPVRYKALMRAHS
jgi:hypothetical protein